MAIEVTENWSGRKMSLQEPWKAEREFVVTGTGDVTAALAATDPTTGVAVPQQGDEHDASASLVCQGPQIKESKGPEHFVITAPYAVDDNGSNADPLKKLTEVTWETVEISEPVDSDWDHQPILNSAGEPIQGGSRPLTYKRLTLVKNMPYFDTTLCTSFEGAVNQNPMTFMGIVQIAAQHMRCCTINPTVTYTTKTKYLPIRFVFDVVLDDTLGLYPFQHRFLDAGTVGWVADAAVTGGKRAAKFSDARGNVFSGSVRLDGTGLPLQSCFSFIKVGEQNGAPVVPGKASSPYKKEFYNASGVLQTAADTNTQACFLYYKKARIADFTPLTKIFT